MEDFPSNEPTAMAHSLRSRGGIDFSSSLSPSSDITSNGASSGIVFESSGDTKTQNEHYLNKSVNE